jgi:hypothetical protein
MPNQFKNGNGVFRLICHACGKGLEIERVTRFQSGQSTINDVKVYPCPCQQPKDKPVMIVEFDPDDPEILISTIGPFESEAIARYWIKVRDEEMSFDIVPYRGKGE